MEVKGSEAQRHHHQVGSEGSVEQRHGSMYENRIRGLRRRTSRQLTTKSVPIKTLVLTPGVACRGPFGLTYGTAVCGPACTVVWQGRVGDHSPLCRFFAFCHSWY